MYRSDVSYPASFHVVGVSHHTAAVGVREQFAFTPAELSELLEREHEAGRSALLLTTCNRCELYWTGEADREAWFRDLAHARRVDLNGALVRFDGADAVRHLFTVAAGLDSQILGESEILGQMRRPVARAAEKTISISRGGYDHARDGYRLLRRPRDRAPHPPRYAARAASVVCELSCSRSRRTGL